MKKLSIKLLQYEYIATIRQTIVGKKLSPITVLISCFIIMLLGLIFAFLRFTGTDIDLYMGLCPLVSILIGAFLFPKGIIDNLVNSEQIVRASFLPIPRRILRYVKAKKALFFVGILFFYILCHLLISSVVSGAPVLFSIFTFIVSVLSFVFAQRIRLFLYLCFGAKKNVSRLYQIVFVLLIVVLLCSGLFEALWKVPFDSIVNQANQIYQQNLLMITFLLLICAVSMDFVCYMVPYEKRNFHAVTKTNSSKSNEIINYFLRKLSDKLNYVGKRDLAIMLHSQNSTQIALPLLSNCFLLPATSILIHNLFTQSSISGISVFYLLIYMMSIGISGPFRKNMEMGNEREMIVLYVLSGTSIGKIQLMRIQSILLCCLPVATLTLCVASFFLKIPIDLTFVGSLTFIATALMSLVSDAFYSINKSSFFNEMNIPNIKQTIIKQLLEMIYSLLFTIPFYIQEFGKILEIGDCVEKFISAYSYFLLTLSIICAFVYMSKLRRNSRYFYGEYSDAI